jgi:hypothetical protein
VRVDEHRTRASLFSRETARRAVPTLVASALALAYVLVAPPSSDLAAQLFRVQLFHTEGFGIWDNWWYAGHNLPGYSVLFPPLAWLVGARLLAALAAVASAAAFEALAREHFGEGAWLGSLWFGAATATSLLSGRLTFALGLLGATLTVLALQRSRPGAATAAAALTALASPVAALFAALAGAAAILAGATNARAGATSARAGAANARAGAGAGSAVRSPRRARAGIGVVLAALAPIIALAIAFPEGGHEPFAFSALWPIPVIAAVLYAWTPREYRGIRIAIALYTLGCLAAYVIPTPVGGNAARLGTLAAGPLAALLWSPRPHSRPAPWLALAAALPLLYLQWQAAIRDPIDAARDPSTQASYYRPLLAYLNRQTGPPFRIEIPFTAEHWEAYEVAPRFALARGWERQLDERDNSLFYSGRLAERTYDRWLHRLAIRFVALPDVPLDASARREAQLIRRDHADLEPPAPVGHWQIYSVRNPTPIVTGAATLTTLGPNFATLQGHRAGRALVRIRFSPYWRLTGVAGCVSPAGPFTRVELRRGGRARLLMGFSLSRVGASSPRCTTP